MHTPAIGIEITEANVPALCEEVWKSQVSHRLLEKINDEIVELLDRVLSARPLDSASKVHLYMRPKHQIASILDSWSITERC